MGPGYGPNKIMRLIDVPVDVVVVGIQDLTLMFGTSSSQLFCSWEPGSEAYIYSLRILAQFIYGKNFERDVGSRSDFLKFVSSLIAEPDSALTA